MKRNLTSKIERLKEMVFILLLSFCFLFNLNAQTTVFSEFFDEANGSTSGASTEGVTWSTSCPSCIPTGDWMRVESGGLETHDSNGPAVWSTGNISVTGSCYATITFSYANNEPYPGSGNLEGFEECGGCNGDPDNPSVACDNCWDYVSAKVSFDGGTPLNILFVGSVNDPQSATVSQTVCVDGVDNITLNFTTQNFANDEDIVFDDIMVVTTTCTMNSSGLTNIQCNNNGTPTDDTDDYITFDLNPIGTNLQNSFVNTSGATTTGGYNVTGAITAIGSYGTAGSYQTASGTAGAGDLAISIADICAPDVNLMNITITDPDVCSAATATCPTTQTQNGAAASVCTLTNEISDWKTAGETPGATGFIDAAAVAPVLVTYAYSETGSQTAFPVTGTEPSGAHSGSGCTNENQTTFAYVVCDLNSDGDADPTTMTADVTVTEVGSIAITYFPPAQTPTIVRDDATCAYSYMEACAGDSFLPATVTGSPAAPGTDPASYTVTVTTTNSCTADFTVDPEACPGSTSCNPSISTFPANN